MTEQLPKPENPVIQMRATDLIGRIASGEISARTVVDAHIERIERVNPQLRAVVATRFDKARRAADEADARRAQGARLKLLHGLPITVKDSFDVAWHTNHAGTHTTRP
ncbi:MAG: amidase family protein [Acidobacteriota bacterium]